MDPKIARALLSLLLTFPLVVACNSEGDGDGGGNGGGDGGAGSVPNGDPTESADEVYGEVHEGQYHLGPVDFSESAYHNACAPAGGYVKSLRDATGLGGEFLAGVSTQFADDGGVCDACIEISTEAGNSIVARVVTYGTTNDPGDIDVSPSVYDAINEDEWPRPMTWRFARCPEGATLAYEFQTEAHQWWSSLWVRNPLVPIEKLEVKSANHSEYFELKRGGDGTFTDSGGFGEGSFTLRVTAIDGQTVTEEFDGFDPGEIVVSDQQFE